MALDPIMSMLAELNYIEPPRPRERHAKPPPPPPPPPPPRSSARHTAPARKAAPHATPAAKPQNRSGSQAPAKAPAKNKPRSQGQAREGRGPRTRAETGNDAVASHDWWLQSQTQQQDGGQGDADGGCAEQDDGEGGSGGNQRSRGLQGNCDYDAELVLDLLPTEADSGIFEVQFPNGETMGVVVDIGASSSSFMLAPHGDALRDLLRRKKMELEQGLGRRMDKFVKLTVL